MKTTKERELELVVRLDRYTTEYESLECKKEKYFKDNADDPSREVIVSLYLQQEYIDTLIRKICMLVRRLNGNEIDFDNELATLVFNKYEPEMKRGLSSLF